MYDSKRIALHLSGYNLGINRCITKGAQKHIDIAVSVRIDRREEYQGTYKVWRKARI